MRILVLFALLFAAAAQANGIAPVPPTAPPREGPLVVVLDPGHGGVYPHDGAHGPKGLVEKQLTLQIAQRLKAQLEAAGATVVLTREDDADVTLAQRAQIANENNADLFLSIHCNSMATREARANTRGVETYFLSPDPTDAEAKLLAELENGGPDAVPLPKTTDAVSGLLADLALGQARNDSAMLAQVVHRNLIRGTRAPSRGVRQAPFLVLAGTKMPAVLVEVGFISHRGEARLLSSERYQDKVAAALTASVKEFADKVLSKRLFPAVAARPQGGTTPTAIAPTLAQPAPAAPDVRPAASSIVPPVAGMAQPR